MIHYQLRCSQEHVFDGWFRDSAGFDAQAGAGLVACPACGDVKVNRALMAPAVPRKSAVAAPEKAAAGMPDHVRATLQKLRGEIERNCDYVGPSFAEEARRIHRGEADARGIYGESTPEQAEALADEGIDVARVPWVPRADG